MVDTLTAHVTEGAVMTHNEEGTAAAHKRGRKRQRKLEGTETAEEVEAMASS